MTIGLKTVPVHLHSEMSSVGIAYRPTVALSEVGACGVLETGMDLMEIEK